MRLDGALRSDAEAEVVARRTRCDDCGAIGSKWGGALSDGGDSQVVMRVVCSSCGRRRELAFRDGGVWTDMVGLLSMGDRGPSTILEPADLLAEYDRVAPTASVHHEHHGDWVAQVQRVEYVVTVLRELEKLLAQPAGAVVSAAEESGDARFAPAWVGAERARWFGVLHAYDADVARLLALDPLRPRATPPRGNLLDAVGRSEPPDITVEIPRGLDIVGRAAENLVARGSNLMLSSLEGVVLDGADLRGTVLCESILTDVWLRRASLENANLNEVKWMFNCRFDDARLDGAKLAWCRGSVLSFAGASLTGANLTYTQLRCAVFREATLAGTVLACVQASRCDFRGASFASRSPTRAEDAMFEDCDFRGANLAGMDLTNATLIACKFAGAIGMPAKTAGWRVIDADFSEAGDGSELGSADRLLCELAS